MDFLAADSDEWEIKLKDPTCVIDNKKAGYYAHRRIPSLAQNVSF
ncbi:unnamed protein product [marine sediment metagenome]|uniref:Uncharacterized protein n=1 Tax=marine sediment metagenome TaxID=412755 RepID=X0V7K4_9ZZZZ